MSDFITNVIILQTVLQSHQNWHDFTNAEIKAVLIYIWLWNRRTCLWFHGVPQTINLFHIMNINSEYFSIRGVEFLLYRYSLCANTKYSFQCFGAN